MTGVAHGGQIVVSEPVAARVPEVTFVDLGEHGSATSTGPAGSSRRWSRARAEFPPLRSMGRYATTLPAQPTPLIGRGELIREVRRRLSSTVSCRSSVPAGSAKHAPPSRPPDVSWRTFRAACGSSTSPPRRMTRRCGLGDPRRPESVPPEQPPEDQLAAYLAGRHALLVVDNCEHVIDRAAEVVDTLLDAAPECECSHLARAAAIRGRGLPAGAVARRRRPGIGGGAIVPRSRPCRGRRGGHRRDRRGRPSPRSPGDSTGSRSPSSSPPHRYEACPRTDPHASR